jgi:hypothetical protein
MSKITRAKRAGDLAQTLVKALSSKPQYQKHLHRSIQNRIIPGNLDSTEFTLGNAALWIINS